MTQPKPSPNALQPVPKRPPLLVRLLVHATMTGMGLIAFLYLIFPTMGIIELIPDAVPFFGSLDEAGATALLLTALSYWGFDVTQIGVWLRGKTRAPLPLEAGPKP